MNGQGWECPWYPGKFRARAEPVHDIATEGQAIYTVSTWAGANLQHFPSDWREGHAR